jgi:hypothetical protein
MLHDLVSDYRRDGYVYCPALLSATESTVLVRETEALLAGERPAERFLLEKDGTTVRTIVNPHLFSDVFERLTIRATTTTITSRRRTWSTP